MITAAIHPDFVLQMTEVQIKCG